MDFSAANQCNAPLPMKASCGVYADPRDPFDVSHTPYYELDNQKNSQHDSSLPKSSPSKPSFCSTISPHIKTQCFKPTSRMGKCMDKISEHTRQGGILSNAMFDVEHALGMFAYSYCTIPAEAIYDKELLKPMMDVISTCHIYIIGYTPIINFIDANQDGEKLTLDFRILSKNYSISYDIPGLTLKNREDAPYLEDEDGEAYWPSATETQARLNMESDGINFDVKYIGQAYGQDGSRNAIDRLLKHETLQKIALKGVPDGYKLSLLLLAIQPTNQLITMMNPFAKNGDSGDLRIQQGLNKAQNTTEAEKISLYEAALIRYFYPEYNKEFKDSFPSTNLKILHDCYDKDFSAIVAEICIDELPFMLCSQEVKPKHYHVIKHHLHKQEDRRMFFGM